MAAAGWVNVMRCGGFLVLPRQEVKQAGRTSTPLKTLWYKGANVLKRIYIFIVNTNITMGLEGVWPQAHKMCETLSEAPRELYVLTFKCMKDMISMDFDMYWDHFTTAFFFLIILLNFFI